MTRATALEEFDLPTRRAQEPELGGGEVGIVEHQRVKLMERQALTSWLDDDQAAVIAQPAPAAFALEELDQLQPLPRITAPLCRAHGIRIG